MLLLLLDAPLTSSRAAAMHPSDLIIQGCTHQTSSYKAAPIRPHHTRLHTTWHVPCVPAVPCMNVWKNATVSAALKHTQQTDTSHQASSDDPRGDLQVHNTQHSTARHSTLAGTPDAPCGRHTVAQATTMQKQTARQHNVLPTLHVDMSHGTSTAWHSTAHHSMPGPGGGCTHMAMLLKTWSYSALQHTARSDITLTLLPHTHTNTHCCLQPMFSSPALCRDEGPHGPHSLAMSLSNKH